MALVLLMGCAKEETSNEQSTATTVALSASEAQAIAREAFVYGFPAVMGYKTIYNYVVDTENPEYKGPFNEVSCVARLFTPNDKAIVTPNADTPYCMFWMDLRAEPQVLTLPEIEPERFYHFQLVDLHTHNFAYVGTLTTGNAAGRFLIAGPDWDGETPEGVNGVIQSETDFIFTITRTQLFGADDLTRVKEVQQSYALQPLSTFLDTPPAAAAPAPDFPIWVEGAQFDERMFDYLDFVMTLIGTPHESEEVIWDRFARIGLGLKSTYDFAALSPDLQSALQAGVREGFGDIEQIIAQLAHDPFAGGMAFGTREFLSNSAKAYFGHENHHLIRAAVAHIGIYGNSASEAMYTSYIVDANGKPYDASANGYTLTFEDRRFPPVNFFWSLTMYDGKTQLFIDNALDRYLLNSPMMDKFKLGEDRSLVLYIAKDSPGGDLESNWLPAPDGPFYMILRLYGPKPEALSGDWTPPALQTVE